MPDIGSPNRPRPPRKLLANGQYMFYDAEQPWGQGCEVSLWEVAGPDNSGKWIPPPPDTYVLANQTTFTVGPFDTEHGIIL